jgi:hypothetical protein
MAQHLRTLRIVHAAMLFATFVYVWLPEAVKRDTGENLSNAFYLAFAVIAATCAGGTFIVRQMMIAPISEHLRAHPEDRSAVFRCFAGNVVVFALCEAIALVGLALRFGGASLKQSAPFYAAGIVLLVLFFPRRPQVV